MGPSKSPAPTPPEPLPLCASSLADLPFSTEEQASTRSARLFARAPLQGCEKRANTVLVIPSMLVHACATKVLPDSSAVLALSQLKLKRSPVVLQVVDENARRKFHLDFPAQGKCSVLRIVKDCRGDDLRRRRR
jgi:hypothetical protein